MPARYMSEIDEFARIAEPLRENMGFLADIKKPMQYFALPEGCDAGENYNCLKNGVEIIGDLPGVETAFASLRNVLQAKGVKELKGAYPICVRRDDALEHEQFTLVSNVDGCEIAAADSDGMRRAVYFLEDRINENAGASITPGEWKRKPFIKHRISRCFFGPTYRAPFFIDELMDDVDYYPEAYLNKLAHEGVNAIWLSMYFRDLPSTVFPGRGKNAEIRFEKLRETVKKCARYGIRIFVFFSEPKLFGDTTFSIPKSEAQAAPEVLGPQMREFHLFCTSSAAGKKYLEESIGRLFKAVPSLGGVINIMYGEDNGACVTASSHNIAQCQCPLCSKRAPGEVFAESARIMSGAMRKFNPDAEFIGWFYAPGQRDYSSTMSWLEEAAGYWPEDCGIMFNFESGGVSRQLDKGRNVFDYSLAYIGPSELFRRVAAKAKKTAAKLQVGCSHENASVPFIPVPSNLYEKYKFLHECGAYAVMQCWYFGNYPGLMNKAAGELSFEPFPESEDEFLISLARPDWGKDAEKVAAAWKLLARGYRQFPANIAFAWYGPLHNSIAWPWHLAPVDKPIAPSWILKQFPEVSGDRIGECLAYQHKLDEAVVLCGEMYRLWQDGADKFEVLRAKYAANPARLADIDLIAAIALQMRSTFNLLKFYSLREDMLFEQKNHLEVMKTLVCDEIENTRNMLTLCEHDSRLGYHSEAENYLFFPEKLIARIKLLESLLSNEFPGFDNTAWGEYTGAAPKGLISYADKSINKFGADSCWCAWTDAENLYIKITTGGDCKVEIEPCRLWPAVSAEVVDGNLFVNNFSFRVEPEIKFENGTITFPLSVFEGYKRKDFPMRINVSGTDGSGAPGEAWPSRLMHGDFNPERTGWLFL